MTRGDVHLKEFRGDNNTLDVTHWIRQIELLGAANSWTEQQTLANACAALCGTALFWLDTVEITTWTSFKADIVHRFGENPDIIAQKLYNCKQRKAENISQYTDRFRQLASKLAALNSAIPNALLLSFYLSGLYPSIKSKCIIKHPTTLDEAISDAKYFEANADVNTEASTHASAPQHNNNRQAYRDDAHWESPPLPRQAPVDQAPPRPPRNPPQDRRPVPQGPRHWPPKGHAPRPDQDLESINRQLEKLQLQKTALQTLAEAQYCGQMIDTQQDDYYGEEYIASSIDFPSYTGAYQHPHDRHAIEIYDEDIDMPDAPIAHRRPRNRVGFDPANLPRQAPQPNAQRQPAEAPRRAPAPPARQPPAAPPRPYEPPGRAGGSNPAAAPRRVGARQPGAFHIAEQLQSTGAKLSLAELFRIAPEVRAEARAMLDKIEGEQHQPQGQHLASRTMHGMCEIPERQTPMQQYEHQRYDRMHLDDLTCGISVVKACVHVNGAEVTAIVDSGASHTMISDIMARKLQLYKHIQPTAAKFYTSSGKLEKPIGKLVDVPITIGDLTLPVDVYVSSARSYSLLLGNNFLAAAEAQIHFGSKELVYRKDLEHFEAIPIEYIEDTLPEAGKAQVSYTTTMVFKEGNSSKDQDADTRPLSRTVKSLQDLALDTAGQNMHSSGQGIDETTTDSSVSSDEETDLEDNDSEASFSFPIIHKAEPQWPAMHTTYSLDVPNDYLIGEIYAYEQAREEINAQMTEERDTDDWMFDHERFLYYNDKYGPFDVDGCADPEGKNAHLPLWWSSSDSCLDYIWTGLNVFCNPPWRLIQRVVDHYLRCRKADPEHTNLVMVLPNWPWQPWYPSVMQHFDIVDYFPTGSQLFTAPCNDKTARVVMGPTRWPVMVVRATGDKAEGNQDWSSKFRPPIGKAGEQAMQELPVAKDINAWRSGRQLTHARKQQLQELMNEQPEIWAWTEDQVGRTTAVAHNIETGDTPPLKQRAYRLSAAEDEIVNAEVGKWLQAGIAVPSQSPWASPVVLVPKKPIDPNDPDEKPKYRLCVDYRKLNAMTKTDSFPLPVIQDALDALGGAQHFSIVDLRSAFLQLPLALEDREKTAFVTKQGLFEFTVLPFGLKNSPSVFQRLMHEVLQGLVGSCCMVFLDDIIVFSVTWEEHLQHLREVFSRLHQYNLRAHPEKSMLCTDSLVYLGHVINAEGNLPDPNKVSAVHNLSAPTTVTEVRAFLGLVGYYRRFIKRFAARAAPLHQLLKKEQVWDWTADCQAAFEDLKQSLLEPPILKRPTCNGQFILQTDWSSQAVAAVLCQRQNGQEHPIAYASRALTPAERNYSVTEGECLAVVWASAHFRQYLWGSKFILQTDHAALRWLMQTKDLTGRLARWALKLQEHDFEVRYRPGSANANADALTRLPINLLEMSDENVVLQLCVSELDHSEPEEATPPPAKRHRSAGTSAGGGTGPTKFQAEGTEPSRPARHRSPFASSSQHRHPWEHPETAANLDRMQFSDSAGCYRSFDRQQKWEALTGYGPLHPKKSAQSDRSESVDPEMTCEVCRKQDQDELMLVCESCNQGYHTFCLVPKLHQVPSTAWFCGDCGGESQRTSRAIDITDDRHVITYLAQKEGALESLDGLERKRVKKRAENYFMAENGILHRHATGDYAARPVCQKQDRQAVIEQYHKLGHWAAVRTAALVAENYYWGGIVQDCRDYIKTCHECQLEHARFSKPQDLQSIPVTDQSFMRVGIDIVGPISTSNSGNKYLVVAMDYLTKWPEVAALPDKSSTTVAAFFLREIIARHGCPKEVLSDNGGEFHGDFDALLQTYRIDHRLTSSNHPQANGLVERFNGVLCSALRKCTMENINDWDTHIPTVLLGYRSTIQASTGFTPFYMLYARQPVLQFGPVVRTADLEALSDMEAVDMILGKMVIREETATQAVDNIERAQEKQRRDYRAKRKYVAPITLQKGDFVTIKASVRRGKINSAANPEIFVIQDFTDGDKTVAILKDANVPPKVWKENVSNLAKFHSTEAIIID